MAFEEWQEHEFFTASTQLEGAGTEDKTQAALKNYYPLSSVQLGVYYDAMKRPDDIIYNVPLCLAFETIDTARLTEAVKKTVAAHPYINTHIEAKDGELVQVRNDSYIPDIGYREMAEHIQAKNLRQKATVTLTTQTMRKKRAAVLPTLMLRNILRVCSAGMRLPARFRRTKQE